MLWPFGLNKWYNCYLSILRIPHLIELEQGAQIKVWETAEPRVWLISKTERKHKFGNVTLHGFQAKSRGE